MSKLPHTVRRGLTALEFILRMCSLLNSLGSQPGDLFPFAADFEKLVIPFTVQGHPQPVGNRDANLVVILQRTGVQFDVQHRKRLGRIHGSEERGAGLDLIDVVPERLGERVSHVITDARVDAHAGNERERIDGVAIGLSLIGARWDLGNSAGESVPTPLGNPYETKSRDLPFTVTVFPGSVRVCLP